MLGIASSQGVSAESVRELLSSLGCRDDQGRYIFCNSWAVAWGVTTFEHKGLSVIADLDIYNFGELCKLIDIEPKNNAHFISLMYFKYGLDFFEKLRGSFSVCIIDGTNKKTVIGTDRFGIKPVYYFSDGNHFIFGPRIKAILSAPKSGEAEINYEAVVDYINLSAIPTPKTIYKRIKKLPPGHFIIISKEEMTPVVDSYYDISYSAADLGEKYFLNRLPISIEDSVKTVLAYELSKGNRVGAFLSGGTDSSTIAGMIKKLSGHVKTFSIGFDEDGYNELEYAKIASRHYGTEHYEYTVTPDDVLKTLDIISDVYDEPFGNASVIPTYFCAALAKKHNIDSLFAGDGGDEIFGGNERYAADKIFSIYHVIPRFLRKGLIEPAVSMMPALSTQVERGKKYIKRANIPQPDRFFSYNPVLSFGKENIFSSDFLKCLNGYDPVSWARDLFANVNTEDDLNRLLYIDMKFAITDNDVRKVTDMSGRAGIRVCYPFLDHELVDFAAAMPSCLKVRGTRIRYMFKKALKDFLPNEIIEKKKHGFGLPIGIWIKSKKDIKSYARETLLNNNCCIKPFFRDGFVEELFRLHNNTGAAFYGDVIWLFLVFEQWLKRSNNI